MSRRPPDDSDPFLKSILDQVKQALEHTEIGGDEEIQEDLLQGVQDSLGVLMGLSAPPFDTENIGPSVTVVDGGLANDAPSSNNDRPHLRVAQPEEETPEDFDNDVESDLEDNPSPSVQVRLFQPEEFLQGFQGSIMQPSLPGTIVLKDEGNMQTIFWGNNEASYRIVCEEGGFELFVGELTIASISPGQSTDLLGKNIQVRASMNQSKGRYLSL